MFLILNVVIIYLDQKVEKQISIIYFQYAQDVIKVCQINGLLMNGTKWTLINQKFPEKEKEEVVVLFFKFLFQNKNL